MIVLSMKTYLALLWGISVLFSMESRSASITTAEPNNQQTTKQLTSSHVLHNETETQPATWDPTHSPAEVSVAAAAEITLSATVETDEAVVSSKIDTSTAGLVATTSSSGPKLLHGSTDAPAVTTATNETQPFHNMTMSETAKPTEGQKSTTTSTDMTAPPTAPPTAPATAPATVSEPSSVTAAVFSTTSSDNSTQANQNLSSPSAFTPTTISTNITSEASHVFVPDSTSPPVKRSETSTVSIELSSTSQPVSATRNLISTSQFPDTVMPNSTTESPSVSTGSANSTTAVSTSVAGILIPRVPKRLPIPTNKSTPANTTAPREVSKSPPVTEVKPCSIHGVVKHCLIAIASLAGLATIFMVTTIALCAKLSARKYKVKKPQRETEMICISSLLPDRTYNYSRQRNPVSNGVLVIPHCGDSDEDISDNLTLSSFLPEHDRFT
ncbi:P-selectin glycoprotein ligand 1-like [Thunnus thynnus]|uniref:P-selectin glycoprotein ligand 1-like n=1 Tax=Thunnus thynnus TaxID=8237 RepID=UPI00352841FE